MPDTPNTPGFSQPHSRLYEVSTGDVHFFVKSETKVDKKDVRQIIEQLKITALAPSKNAVVENRDGKWRVISEESQAAAVEAESLPSPQNAKAANKVSQFAIRKINRQSKEVEAQRTFSQIWRDLIQDQNKLSVGLKVLWNYVAAPCLALWQITQEGKRIALDRFSKHHLPDPQTYQEMIPFLRNYEEIIKEGLDLEETPGSQESPSRDGGIHQLISQAIEMGKDLINDATRIDAVNRIAENIQKTPPCLIPLGYTNKEKQFCPILALFSKNEKGEYQVNLFHLRGGQPELSGTFLLTNIYEEAAKSGKSGESDSKEIDPKKLKHLIHNLSLPGSEAWTRSNRAEVDLEREEQRRFWIHQREGFGTSFKGSLPEEEPVEISGESWLLTTLGEAGAQQVLEATPLLEHKKDKHDFFHILQRISQAANLEGPNKLEFLFHFITHGIDAIEGGKRYASIKDRREAIASMKKWIGRLENHCAKRKMDLSVMSPDFAAKIQAFKEKFVEEDISINLKGIKYSKKVFQAKFSGKLAGVVSKVKPWIRLSDAEREEIGKLKMALTPETGILSNEAAQAVHKQLVQFTKQADQLVAQKEYRHAQKLVHELFRALPVEGKIWSNIDPALQVEMTKSLSGLYQFQWEAHLRQAKTYLYPEETIALLKPIMAIQHMYAAQQVYNQEAPGVPFFPMKRSFIMALTTHSPYVRFGDPLIEKELDSIFREYDQLKKENLEKWQRAKSNPENPFEFPQPKKIGKPGDCERDYTYYTNYGFIKKEFMGTGAAEKLIYETDPETASQNNVFFAAMRQTCMMLDMQARGEAVLCPHFKGTENAPFLNWAIGIRNRAEKIAKEENGIQRGMRQLRFAEVNRELGKLDRLHLIADQFPSEKFSERALRICGSHPEERGVAYLPDGYHFSEESPLKHLEISLSSDSSSQLTGESIAAGKYTSGGVDGRAAEGYNNYGDNRPELLEKLADTSGTGASEKQHLLNAVRDKPADMDQFTYFMLSNTECIDRNWNYYSTNVMEPLNWIRERPRLLNNPSVKRRIEMILLRPLSLKRAMENQPDYFVEYARTLNSLLEELKETDPETFLHVLSISDLLHRYAKEDVGIKTAIASKGEEADLYQFKSYSSRFKDHQKPENPGKTVLEELEESIFDRKKPNPLAAINILEHYYHSQRKPESPIPVALIQAAYLFQNGVSFQVTPYKAYTWETWINDSLLPAMKDADRSQWLERSGRIHLKVDKDTLQLTGSKKNFELTRVDYQVPLPDSVKNHKLFVALFGAEDPGLVSLRKDGDFKVFQIRQGQETFEVRQRLHSQDLEIRRKIRKDTYFYEIPMGIHDPLLNRGIWRKEGNPKQAILDRGTQFYSLTLDADGKLIEIQNSNRKLTAVAVEHPEQFVPYAHPDDLLFFKDKFGTIQEIHILSRNIVLRKGESKNEWVVDHPQLVGETQWTQKVASKELQALFKEELHQFVLPVRRTDTGQELLITPWMVKVHAAKKKLQFLKEPEAPVEMVISVDGEGKIKTTPSSAMYLAYLLAEKRNYSKALHFLEQAKKSSMVNRELEREQFMRIRDLIADMQPQSLREMAMQLKLELAVHELLNPHKHEGYMDRRYEEDMKRIGERYFHYKKRLQNAPQEAKDFYKSSIQFTDEETIELNAILERVKIPAQEEYSKQVREDRIASGQQLVSQVSGSHRKFDNIQALKAKTPKDFSARVIAFTKDFKPDSLTGIASPRLTSETLLGHFFHLWNQIVEESGENFDLDKWELQLSKPISESENETYNLCEVARGILLEHAKKARQKLDPDTKMNWQQLIEIKKKLEPLGGKFTRINLLRTMKDEDPFGLKVLEMKIAEVLNPPSSPTDVQNLKQQLQLGMDPKKLLENLLAAMPKTQKEDEKRIQDEENRIIPDRPKPPLRTEPLRAGETTLQILYENRQSYSASERLVIEKTYAASGPEDRNAPLIISEFYSQEVMPGITLNDLKHEAMVVEKLQQMEEMQAAKPPASTQKPSLSDQVEHGADRVGIESNAFSHIASIAKKADDIFAQSANPRSLKHEEITRFFSEGGPAEDECASMRKAEKQAIREAIQAAVATTNDKEAAARHLSFKQVKGMIKELAKLSLENDVSILKQEILEAYRAQEDYKRRFPDGQADWEIIEELEKSYQARTLPEEMDSLFTRYLVHKTAQQQLSAALKILQSITSNESEKVCQDKTRRVYELLQAGCNWQRYFVQNGQGTYDLQERARYLLVTESKRNIIYREGQLQVLQEFGKNMSQWLSLRMGVGKTSELMPKVPDMLGHCLLVVPSELLEMNSLSFDQSTLDLFEQRAYLFRSSINDPTTPGFLAEQLYKLRKAEAEGQYIVTNLEQIANIYHLGLSLVNELNAAYQAVAKEGSTDEERQQLLVVLEKLKWTKEIMGHLRKLPYFGDEVDAIFGIENEINRAIGNLVQPDPHVMKASRVILTSIIQNGEKPNGHNLGKHIKGGTAAALFVGKSKQEVQTFMSGVLDQVLKEKEFVFQYPEAARALNSIQPREALLAYLTGQSTVKPNPEIFDRISDSITGPLKALFSETLPTMLTLDPGNDFGLSNDENALGVIVPKSSRGEEAGQRYSNQYEIAVAHQLGYIAMNLCKSETGTTERYIEVALNHLQDHDSRTYGILLRKAQDTSASVKEGEEFSLVSFVMAPENWELRLRLLDVVTVQGGFLKVCDEKIALNVQDLLFGLRSGGVTGTSNPFSMPYTSEKAMFPAGNTKSVEAEMIVTLALGCGEEGLKSEVLVPKSIEELLQQDEKTVGIINEAGMGMEGLNTRQWVAKLREVEPKRTFLFVDPQTRKPFLWEVDAEEPISYSSRELPKGTVVVWGPADTRGTDLPIDPSASDGSIYYFPSTTSNLQKVGQSVFRNRQLGQQYQMKVCVSEEFRDRLLEDKGDEANPIVRVGDVLNYCLDASIQQQAPLNLKAQLHKIQGHVKGAFLRALFTTSRKQPQAMAAKEEPSLRDQAEMEAAIFKMANPYFFHKEKTDFQGDREATGTMKTLDRVKNTYEASLQELDKKILGLNRVINGQPPIHSSIAAKLLLKGVPIEMFGEVDVVALWLLLEKGVSLESIQEYANTKLPLAAAVAYLELQPVSSLPSVSLEEVRAFLESSDGRNALSLLPQLQAEQQQKYLRMAKASGPSNPNRFEDVEKELKETREQLQKQYQYFTANQSQYQQHLPDQCDGKSVHKSHEKVKEKQKEKQKEKAKEMQVVSTPRTFGVTQKGKLEYQAYEGLANDVNIGYQNLNMTPQMKEVYNMIDRFDGSSFAYLMYDKKKNLFMLCTKQDYQQLLNSYTREGAIVEFAFFQLTPKGCEYAGGNIQNPKWPDPEHVAVSKFFMGMSTFNVVEKQILRQMVNGPDADQIQEWVTKHGTRQQEDLLQELVFPRNGRYVADVFARELAKKTTLDGPELKFFCRHFEENFSSFMKEKVSSQEAFRELVENFSIGLELEEHSHIFARNKEKNKRVVGAVGQICQQPDFQALIVQLFEQLNARPLAGGTGEGIA